MSALQTIDASTAPHLQSLTDAALVAIFERLDTENLLNAAELNPRYQKLILKHIIVSQYRLDEQPIAIYVGWSIFVTIHERNTPLATNYAEAVRILRTFGSVFNQLNIHFANYRNPDSRRLFDDIGTYCGTAMQEIVLYNVRDNMLGEWRNSFKQARYVIVKGFHAEHPIVLNDLFPRMERFELTINRPTSLECLDDYFSRLRHFELNVMHSGEFDEEHVRHFIRWNQRLESLHLRNVGDSELLQYVNEHIPRLEVLRLENRLANLVGESAVRFEYVTNFTLGLAHEDFELGHAGGELPSLEFRDLQSFRLIGVADAPIERFIGFIARNAKLNCVVIEDFELALAQLMSLVEQLPELRELSFELNHRTVDNDLRHFLANIEDSKLERISVSVVKLGDDSDTVLHSFSSKWSLTYEYASGFRRLMTFSRD